jgi:undecaprenyl pyrophosphate phosphatase UppP
MSEYKEEIKKRMKIWHDYDILAAKRQVEKLNRFIYNVSIFLLITGLISLFFELILKKNLFTVICYLFVIFTMCRAICDIDNEN